MKSVGSQFELTIELGNDAMRTPRHVAKALRQVADRLAKDDGITSSTRGGTEGYGRIRDVNGNTIGEWGYTNDDETANDDL